MTRRKRRKRKKNRTATLTTRAAVVAAADPAGEIRLSAEGVCHGSIVDSPRGSNGFGYDPIFQPEGFDHTFGEMSDDEKRSLSHRGRASIEFIRKMSDFTGV